MKKLALLLLLVGIGGCGTTRILGNGEFYFEYGTKIAFGHHTEKSDETQTASSSIDWNDGPIAWAFEWLLKSSEESKSGTDNTGSEESGDTDN